MPFEKVDTQVDFPARERAILEFWRQNGIFEKLRRKNAGKPKWSFLDGPITANNPMGVHHAWGRTYKDAYQRYFAMTGHELRYQNGFDCQGLWVEVEVEKELKLNSKRDIENLVPGDRFASIDRFVTLCKDRVDFFAERQTKQSIRLGYWMDWDRGDDWKKPPDERRSYFTMSEENNYTIWSFLKKCHDRQLVYRGYDAMPWCPRCAVGLSQMEMHEGYRLVAHRAVFVRFPLRQRPGENLLVWTTTPWTLTSNVAVAVNPELIYLKVKHRDQFYYLAKGAFTAQRLEEQFKRKEWVEGVPKLKTLEQIFKEKGGYEVVGELFGRQMVDGIGWDYEGPFDELPAQRRPGGCPDEIAAVVQKPQKAQAKSAKDAHKVIAWEAVGETEGTGIVHIAPGCGKEDFGLGSTYGLPPIAPLDDEGVYLPWFGELNGKSAVDPATTDSILNDLKQKGLLLEVEKYPHSYPHCWRCKTELLFRLVDEWFIDMKWRDEIMRVVEDATFLPESINGKARELDWLKNMGNWMISKKRYWGLALPIWWCESCNAFDVIGSREELKERAIEGWEQFEGQTPHRPWIDLVKLKCAKCGGKASRIPDVGNPWLDAGIVPYSTMGYNRDRKYWEQWFPADFITESFPGQFRNWFYAILAMSTMMEGRAPFKVLLGHATVLDEWGRPMHKSSGNSIAFDDAADQEYEITDPKGQVSRHKAMGADVMRWMYCRQNPAANINFGPGPADELRAKFVLKLWNTYAFFCNYARLDGFDANALPVPMSERTDLDRWILSDLQFLIETAREEFESYNVQFFCTQAERFVDELLSNWYVRRTRRRFWKGEHGTDKVAAYQTLYTVLVTLTKLCAPIMPFLTEEMYQNLKPARSASEEWPESVHLCDFPEADESLIDNDLSEDMTALLRLVAMGLAVRSNAKVKVRQPLAEMRVQPGHDSDRRAVERFGDQICEELNVKEVTLHEAADGPLVNFAVSLNMKVAGPKFGPRVKEVEAALAEANAEYVTRHFASTLRPISLPCLGGDVLLEKPDVRTFLVPYEGWQAIGDAGTVVAIDACITDELKREGMAREVIRHVQQARKDAGLEMEDRIELYLGTESAMLRQAIEEYRDYIAAETLTVRWSEEPLGDGAATANVKVDGQALTIQLRKA